MDRYEVLRAPLMSEKNDMLADLDRPQYAFAVALDANKQQIRQAVEGIFGVKVEQVRTMIVAGKPRRWGRHRTRSPRWKKAIVTLARGERLDAAG